MDSKKKLKNLLKIEDIFFIISFAVFFFFLPSLFTKGADLSCILASGEYVFNHFSLITPKFFLYTEPNQFFCQSTWLADTVFFFLYKQFGIWVLILLCSIIITSIFTYLYRKCSEVNPYWIVNLGLIAIGIISISDFMEINSRIFSYLLFTIFYYTLKALNIKDVKRINYITLAAIFIFWSNINTDFVYALVVLLILILANLINSSFSKNISYLSPAKSYIKIMIVCIIASLLNINFYYPYLMLVSFLSQGLIENYGYLASPNFHVQIPYFFYEVIILMLIFLAGLANHKLKLEETLIILVFLGLSLFSAINVPFFIIIVLPIIASITTSSNYKLVELLNAKLFRIFCLKPYEYKPIIPVLFTSIIAIIYALNLIPWSNVALFKNYPHLSVNFLKDNNINGRILNPIGWGCYINQELNCRVFSTENVYMQSKKTLTDLSSINDIYDNYNTIMKNYNIDLVLYPTGSPLDVALSDNSDWYLLYKDAISVIYKKND